MSIFLKFIKQKIYFFNYSIRSRNICYTVCDNVNKKNGVRVMIKDYFLRLFQSTDKEEDLQELEMEIKMRQQLKDELEKQEEREQWAKTYSDLVNNVLPEVHGLVSYREMTSKFHEKYIIAISQGESQFGNAFNRFSKVQGRIDIFGIRIRFRSPYSSQYLLFDICEKELDGKTQKYIFITDVIITGSEGRGSLAMEALIAYAKEIKCLWIQGERVIADERTEEHKTRRDNFYKKYDFSFEGHDSRTLMLRL